MHELTDVVLEARGLAKRYRRGSWALGGIDLVLPAGGITALVGPNAAGKSTLIKTWVGFEKPTRGSVSVMASILGVNGHVRSRTSATCPSRRPSTTDCRSTITWIWPSSCDRASTARMRRSG